MLLKLGVSLGHGWPGADQSPQCWCRVLCELLGGVVTTTLLYYEGTSGLWYPGSPLSAPTIEQHLCNGTGNQV